jgi:hypothetical protein
VTWAARITACTARHAFIAVLLASQTVSRMLPRSIHAACLVVAVVLAAAGVDGARHLADDDFHFTQCNQEPVRGVRT